MNTIRIEHVNLAVADCERTAAEMIALFGWHERWRGPSQLGGRTIHVGSDTDYVALWSPEPGQTLTTPFGKGAPLNHIGIEVADRMALDALEARVRAAGLTPFNHADYSPGRRFYWIDRDGIEFEAVAYG